MKGALYDALAIGSGGFLGALARYGLSGLVQRGSPFATFPMGTLVVNLVGCLAIGVLTGLADSRNVFSPELRAFVLIGLLGSFTTFSTFGHESMTLLREGEQLRAFIYVGVHVVAGLGLVWLGYAITAGK